MAAVVAAGHVDAVMDAALAALHAYDAPDAQPRTDLHAGVFLEVAATLGLAVTPVTPSLGLKASITAALPAHIAA